MKWGRGTLAFLPSPLPMQPIPHSRKNRQNVSVSHSTPHLHSYILLVFCFFAIGIIKAFTRLSRLATVHSQEETHFVASRMRHRETDQEKTKHNTRDKQLTNANDPGIQPVNNLVGHLLQPPASCPNYGDAASSTFTKT